MKKEIKLDDFKKHYTKDISVIPKIKKIINENNLERKYNLIIEYICDSIDNDVKKNNHCDFQEGQCIANRLGKSTHENNGCCYQNKVGLCKYLKNERCEIQNIACKVFMCRYLESKGVKYDIKKIFPVKLFFNRKQVKILEKNYFKTKEEVVCLLIENS